MSKLINKEDKRFVTFIVCLICIPLILILLLIVAQSCARKKETKTSYVSYEEKMENAAIKYLSDIDQVPYEEGDYIIVQLDTLVEQSYINSTEKALKDSTCSGQVVARKGYTVNYIPYLECKNYKTQTLKNSIMGELTKDSDGLYETADGYVFRGLAVNNFVEITGVEYRIISMDKNGIVKLYNRVSETDNMYWDRKYNVATQNYAGLNIYGDSYIVERMYHSYLFDERYEAAKTVMVPVDVCVYSKDLNNRFLDKSSCAQVAEKQYITLLGLDDYMNASLDKNCVDLYSKSCVNYNYLDRVTGVNTWTKDVVSNNSYQAYRIIDGVAYAENIDTAASYNHVIYIDGNELIYSGNGSKEKPYTIKKY